MRRAVRRDNRGPRMYQEILSDADRHFQHRHVKSVFAAPSQLRIVRVVCGYKCGERKCQSDVGGISYGERKQLHEPMIEKPHLASMNCLLPFVSAKGREWSSRIIPEVSGLVIS